MCQAVVLATLWSRTRLGACPVRDESASVLASSRALEHGGRLCAPVRALAARRVRATHPAVLDAARLFADEPVLCVVDLGAADGVNSPAGALPAGGHCARRRQRDDDALGRRRGGGWDRPGLSFPAIRTTRTRASGGPGVWPRLGGGTGCSRCARNARARRASCAGRTARRDVRAARGRRSPFRLGRRPGVPRPCISGNRARRLPVPGDAREAPPLPPRANASSRPHRPGMSSNASSPILREHRVDDEVIADGLEAEHGAQHQQWCPGRPRLRAAGRRVPDRVLRHAPLVSAERLRESPGEELSGVQDSSGDLGRLLLEAVVAQAQAMKEQSKARPFRRGSRSGCSVLHPQPACAPPAGEEPGPHQMSDDRLRLGLLHDAAPKQVAVVGRERVDLLSHRCRGLWRSSRGLRPRNRG